MKKFLFADHSKLDASVPAAIPHSLPATEQYAQDRTDRRCWWSEPLSDVFIPRDFVHRSYSVPEPESE